MRKVFIGIFVFLFSYAPTRAQQSLVAWDSAVRNYIKQYKPLAEEEQIRSGVPAAITLAQGIFETSAGQSELCLNASNHFGIKCKGNWVGDTYTYDDDAPNECFRKYKTVLDSYKDHSDFLRRNTRYQQLFGLQITDYKGWANGLLKAGYATNKSYATRLISFIEQYDLNQYTQEAINRTNNLELSQRNNNNQDAFLASTDASFVPDPRATSAVTMTYDQKENADTAFYQITEKNGLKGFYAPKGDLLLNYAITHRIRYGKLLSINNLPDEPLPSDMFIYLEKKLKIGLVPTYTVPRGMDLLQISQETGVDLNEIRRLNLLKPGEEPVVGTVLNLREPVVSQKPRINGGLANGTESKEVSNRASNDDQDGDYIEIRHDAPVPTSKTAEVAPEASVVNGAEMRQDASINNSGNNVEEVEPAAAPTPQKRKKGKKLAQAKSQPVDTPLTKAEKLKSMMDGIVYREGGAERPTETTSVQQKVQEKTQKTSADNNLDAPQTNANEKLRNYMDNLQNDDPSNRDEDEAPTVAPARQNKPVTTPVSNLKDGRFYTVRSGDTAFSIAKRFGITLEQLKKWNSLPASMVVSIGRALQVAP